MKPKALINLLTLAAVLLGGRQASAGDVRGLVHSVSALDGIGHSHISNAITDKTGFLWLATWNGLARYDGNNIHWFKPIMLSEGTIDSNRIYNVKPCGDDRLWCVSSDNQLFTFDRHNYRFENVTTATKAISAKKVKVVTPLKNGHTWVIFKDFSAIRLDNGHPSSGGIFFPSAGAIVRGAEKIAEIGLGAGGDEWILTDAGAYNHTRRTTVPGRFFTVEAPGGRTWLVRPDGSLYQPESRRTIASPFVAGCRLADVRVSGNTIVMGGEGGTAAVDAGSGHTTLLSSTPSVYIFLDSRRRVWSFTPDGDIIMASDLTRPETRRLSAASDGSTEPMKNPQLIYETDEGVIVTKPHERMMSFYDEAAGRLEPLSFFSRSGAVDFSPGAIKKFYPGRHNLWLITADGADCLSFHTGKFTRQSHEPASETRALLTDSRGVRWQADRDRLYPSQSAPLDIATVYTLAEDDGGNIWAGTKGNGLWIVSPDGRRDRIGRDAVTTGGLPSDSIYDICFQGRDRVWLGSFGSGLIRGDRRPDGSWAFVRAAGRQASLKIRRIHPVDRNTLLLATTEGLVTADVTRPEAPRYYTNRFRAEEWGLKGNDIIDIVAIGKRLFVCVFGNGVSEITSASLRSDDLRFRHYPLTDGAESGQIRAAVADGDKVWIVSAGSIACLSTSTGNVSTVPAGYITGKVGFTEATPVNDGGVITVGTTDGTLTFNARDIVAETDTTSLRLTAVRFHDGIEVIPLDDPDSLTIGRDRRSLSLFLSTMAFDDRAEHSIRYRLEDCEEGWNYQHGNTPTVIYNNIAPGTHRLVIEMKGADGTWHAARPALTLEVTPTVTETVWFRIMTALLAALGVIGLVLAIVHYRRLHDIARRKYSLLMTVEDIDRGLVADAQAAGTVADADKEFLESTVKYLTDNIDNPSLVVEDLARHHAMSRTAFYRRMKEITGLSPVSFIRQLRIRRAIALLDKGSLSIAEVAYRVGFEDPKYFSKCFKAETMMTPSQYLAQRESHS